MSTATKTVVCEDQDEEEDAAFQTIHAYVTVEYVDVSEISEHTLTSDNSTGLVKAGRRSPSSATTESDERRSKAGDISAGMETASRSLSSASSKRSNNTCDNSIDLEQASSRSPSSNVNQPRGSDSQSMDFTMEECSTSPREPSVSTLSLTSNQIDMPLETNQCLLCKTVPSASSQVSRE